MTDAPRHLAYNFGQFRRNDTFCERNDLAQCPSQRRLCRAPSDLHAARALREQFGLATQITLFHDDTLTTGAARYLR
jgi:hypothetical protein